NTTLAKSDGQQWQRFAVTRPIRAITDLATTESDSRDIVEQALREARRRGVITSRGVTDLRQRNLPQWFDAHLRKT
ncbi:MAG: hypothetical protein JWM99_2222, partial [Verrucomicrobiales bacterium]|nr:hypothetical protein [Verrucomicrobiales bacterium]